MLAASREERSTTGGLAVDHEIAGSAPDRFMSGTGDGTAALNRPLHVILPWGGQGLQLTAHVGGIALLGALAAASVGYLTSVNPAAAPAHLAVPLRVLIIVALLMVGVYAQMSGAHARMGALLLGAGFFAALWLLNGSAGRIAFSIGALATGAAPAVFFYILLAYPSGNLRARRELWFWGVASGVMALPWAWLYLTAAQPPFATPLIRCAPECPRNVFSLGSAAPAIAPGLKAAFLLGWTGLACGSAVITLGRLRSASGPVRRLIAPIAGVALAYAVCLLSFLIARRAGWSVADTLGFASTGVVLAIPLAIFVGLAMERLFLGRALANLVAELVSAADPDPQALMGHVLNDPTLTIAYRRTGRETYVDSRGRDLTISEAAEGRAVSFIDREGVPVAAVLFDANLADQRSFVEAAAAVAILRLERAQLEAGLMASTRELATSRARLVETANAERQRIERDLHDGVQQHLVGLRLRLALAAESLKADPTRGEQMVAAIGEQMDDVLDELRALARGVYPSVLSDRGVAEALKSVARLGPLPVSIRTRGVKRYTEDIEVAVYFSCLEALQNSAKHAGPGSQVAVSLWQSGCWLCFEVRDSGCGFDPSSVRSGNGLLNMHDRIEAVGGELIVHSRAGCGTVVAGRVPAVAREDACAVTRG